jgi:hypothetical protein
LQLVPVGSACSTSRNATTVVGDQAVWRMWPPAKAA